MKRIFLLTSILILHFLSLSQKNVFITISPKANGNDLVMGTELTSLNGVKFNLDHFDYYLSDLYLIHDGGQILDLTDTVFLVEPGSHVLYLGFLNVTTVEQVNFAIGVSDRVEVFVNSDVYQRLISDTPFELSGPLFPGLTQPQVTFSFAAPMKADTRFAWMASEISCRTAVSP